MGDDKGKKSVCLRDQLIAKKEALRQQELDINEQLRALDTTTRENYVAKRVREAKIIAKTSTPSRVISEAHSKQLEDTWTKIYRHDLDPEVVARAVEDRGKGKARKTIAMIEGETPTETEAFYDKGEPKTETAKEIIEDLAKTRTEKGEEFATRVEVGVNGKERSLRDAIAEECGKE